MGHNGTKHGYPQEILNMTKFSTCFHCYCDTSSLLLRHLFVEISTKMGVIFRGSFFVAISRTKK
jgi:hypothetical protein